MELDTDLGKTWKNPRWYMNNNSMDQIILMTDNGPVKVQT